MIGIGTIVQGSQGRYAILSMAGEGGVGTVYKARNEDSGNVVAVKVLHAKRFDLNDIQHERFLIEIGKSLSISSPHIVHGIDSGEYEGEPFLVLEWLSGGTLQQFIETQDYSFDDVISFTAQLLNAFRDLQKLGLVHRDLKPNNVLLTANKVLKLSDLGLIKKVTAPAYLTATGAHIGSLLYISKRQRFSPGEVTSRDDFYSLCLILYELVSKRKIHNNNTLLVNLRPTIAPMALCSFIDRGMLDLDDWEDTLAELCQYIDLEGQRINPDYTGSLIVPEHLIQREVDRVVKLVENKKGLTKDGETKTNYEASLLSKIVKVISDAFDNCASEFAHCGVITFINPDYADEDTFYYSASFGEKLDALLDASNLSESVNDRLYGWIKFITNDDGSIQIETISGKHLYADTMYMPKDTYIRRLIQLDAETITFLKQVGRALAVGAAIGAMERIEDCLEIVEEE